MTKKVLTFYLCEALFGIDITLVKEINRNVEYTSVPDAKPHIVGLYNMRGQVVTFFNLAKLMRYETGDEIKRSTCIILKAGPNDPNQTGFLVDRPGDVVDINEDEKESLPANIGTVESEFISNVVKLKNELLIIVDPKKIFES